VLGRNALSAHRFLIAFPGFCAANIFGFCECRVDLLASNGLS
jgi:hypothetical protein